MMMIIVICFLEVFMRGRRKRNYFTPEQIKELRDNPYTYSVTYSNIRFTLEFKELFWSRYQEGELVKDIFRSLGYDVDVLGDGRMYNFSHKLSVDKENETNLSASYQENQPTNTPPKKLTDMEHELIYLRQEVEFLKKLSALENQKKPKQRS